MKRKLIYSFSYVIVNSYRLGKFACSTKKEAEKLLKSIVASGDSAQDGSGETLYLILGD